VFRRRKDDARDDQGTEEVLDETSADDAAPGDDEPADTLDEASAEAAATDDEEPGDEPAPLAGGPWDVAAGDITEAERANLGALRVPVLPDFEIQIQVQPTEVDADGNPVNGIATTVLMVHGESALELTAFAAPKKSGLWDEVRDEIADGLKQNQSADTREVEGPFGAELQAVVPVPIPEEIKDQLPPEVIEQGYLLQPFRFLGVDGPRWLLRGTVHGAATQDREQALLMEQVFSQVVVDRGDAPMPPRDVLVLTLPNAPGQPAPGEEPLPSINPLDRGPTITEVR
jgi:hypothetical protein